VKRVHRFVPAFVQEVPRELEAGTLYVSMEYGTVVHLCACGCGSEVVTPLHPAKWALTYDGEAVSLRPSIGSWGLPCGSHYWIDGAGVRWAPRWTPEQIEWGQRRDGAELVDHAPLESSPSSQRDQWWSRVLAWLRGG
jgi:Family of unknown function (DUF6527)